MGKTAGKLLIAAALLGIVFATGCAANKDYELIATSEEPTSETTGETIIEEFKPAYYYMPLGAVEVEGRQGVCADENYYWVSSSRSLAKYDKDWNLLKINKDPFKDLKLPDPALAGPEGTAAESSAAESSSTGAGAAGNESAAGM